ncbi:aminotransferase class IV [Streptomyces sp. NPDC058611]|uniref:aminotransferase class IV n=1 Tax=unclassified Streptomyces TaxID=2593676 RepID=UPI003656546C
MRGGAVRGLELHLRRMEEASRELFDEAADAGRIRALLGQAVAAAAGDGDASVRVTVVPHESSTARTDVVVAVSDPVSDAPRPPLWVRTAVYERELPHLKHVATMGLTHQARAARKAGYDDVLFLGGDGAVREGSVWNAAFWDGEQVVWPDAPVLPGITMQLLRAALTRDGVPWTTRVLRTADLPLLLSAAAVNSHCAAQPVGRVDGVDLARDAGALVKVLNSAWAGVAWEPLG